VLSRSFIALYVSVFVATMGISMVSPLLPVYAKELGASGVWLGLTFSIFAIVQTIFGPFAGRLSDRYGRKPFIMAGLIIYMISALGYLTAQSFFQVIAFRAFSGLGTSLIFSVAQAYLGDLTPPGHEGRWSGAFATANVIGFGTGPLFAGVFRQVFGFHSVFIAMAVLMALSATIVGMWLPKRPRRAGPTGTHVVATAPTVGFRNALSNRLVVALTIHMALISLAVGSSLSFLALRLDNDLHIRPIPIGLAFASQDITGGLTQPFFGRLADRGRRRLLVAAGLGFYGTFVLMLSVAHTFPTIVLLLFLMGGSNGLSQVSAGALQIVAGRRVGMGTLLGLTSAGNGIGIVVGSVVGGLLVDQFSISAAFVFSGLVILFGVAVFLTLTRGVDTSGGASLMPVEAIPRAGSA